MIVPLYLKLVGFPMWLVGTQDPKLMTVSDGSAGQCRGHQITFTTSLRFTFSSLVSS